MYLITFPMMLVLFFSGCAFCFFSGWKTYELFLIKACKKGKGFLKHSNGTWFPFNPYRRGEK
jgi:hypothetical protein